MLVILPILLTSIATIFNLITTYPNQTIQLFQFIHQTTLTISTAAVEYTLTLQPLLEAFSNEGSFTTSLDLFYTKALAIVYVIAIKLNLLVVQVVPQVLSIGSKVTNTHLISEINQTASYHQMGTVGVLLLLVGVNLGIYGTKSISYRSCHNIIKFIRYYSIKFVFNLGKLPYLTFGGMVNYMNEKVNVNNLTSAENGEAVLVIEPLITFTPGTTIVFKPTEYFSKSLNSTTTTEDKLFDTKVAEDVYYAKILTPSTSTSTTTSSTSNLIETLPIISLAQEVFDAGESDVIMKDLEQDDKMDVDELEITAATTTPTSSMFFASQAINYFATSLLPFFINQPNSSTAVIETIIDEEMIYLDAEFVFSENLLVLEEDIVEMDTSEDILATQLPTQLPLLQFEQVNNNLNITSTVNEEMFQLSTSSPLSSEESQIIPVAEAFTSNIYYSNPLVDENEVEDIFFESSQFESNFISGQQINSITSTTSTTPLVIEATSTVVNETALLLSEIIVADEDSSNVTQAVLDNVIEFEEEASQILVEENISSSSTLSASSTLPTTPLPSPSSPLPSTSTSNSIKSKIKKVIKKKMSFRQQHKIVPSKTVKFYLAHLSFRKYSQIESTASNYIDDLSDITSQFIPLVRKEKDAVSNFTTTPSTRISVGGKVRKFSQV